MFMLQRCLVVLNILAVFWSLQPVTGSQNIVIEKTIYHNFTVADIRTSFTLPCMFHGKTNHTLVSVQWNMGDVLIYYRQAEEGRQLITNGNKAFFDEVKIEQSGSSESYPLTIKSIQAHFAQRYECSKAIRRDNNVTVFKEVHIVNLEKVTYLRSIDEKLNTSCYTNSTPASTTKVVWLKEKAELLPFNGSLIRDLKKTQYNDLVIEQLTVKDFGTYSCYDRGLKVRSILLLVLDYVIGKPSSSITIPCGQNRKDAIKVLTKDDAIIYYDGTFFTNENIFSLDNQGNLVLSSVVSEDAGMYKCYGAGVLYKTINLSVTSNYTKEDETSTLHRSDGEASLSTTTNEVTLATTVELTCDFQSSWKIIYWEFEGTLIHIQSSFTNWTKLSPKHAITHLAISTTSQSLFLNNITTMDIGRYKCKVQYEFSEADSNELLLRSPTPVSFKVVLPLKKENQAPFITCQPSITGQPIIWFKGARLLNFGGTQLSDQSDSDDNGKVTKNSTRFVFNTNSSFNGTYSCFGENVHRSFDVSYSFNLTALEKNKTTDGVSRTSVIVTEPETTRHIKGPSSVSPQTNVKLKCNGTENVTSHSNVVVYWFYGDQLVLLTTNQNFTWTNFPKYGTNQIDHLTITSVDEEDTTSQFTCYVTSLDDHVTTKSSPYRFKLQADNAIGIEATPVELTCNPSRKGVYVMWIKDSFIIVSIAAATTFRDHTYATQNTSQSSLVIRRIGENEKGVYKCMDFDKKVRRTIYFNTVEDISTSVRLKSNPSRTSITIATDDNGNPKIDAGREFELSCNFDFKPDTVYWTWNGISLFHATSGEYVWSSNFLYSGRWEKNSFLLLVDYFSKYDFGLFECYAGKGNVVYKTTITVNQIKYEARDQNDQKVYSIVDDLSIKLDTTGTAETGFNLICSYTNSAYNNSMVFWLKDDSLIYVTNSSGYSLEADDRFEGVFSDKSSNTFRLKYKGVISSKTNGKYTCSVARDVVPDTPDDVDEKPKPTRFVYVSQNLQITKFVDGPVHLQIEKSLEGPQETTLNLKCKYDNSIQVGAPEYVYWSYKKDAVSPEQFLMIHSDETFAEDGSGKSYQAYNYLKQFVIPDQVHFSTQPAHCRFRAGCTELVISDVNIDNGGTFKCYVKPFGKDLVSATKDIELKKESKALISFRIFDSIQCRVSNLQNAQIIWTKDDQILYLESDLVLVGYEESFKMPKSNELEFHNISSKQNGQYKCYSKISGNLLSYWEANLKEAFVKVEEENTLQIGTNYTITCHYSNLEPELVYWEKGNDIIYFDGSQNTWSSSRYRGNTDEKFKLTLSVLGVNSQDVGNYICHVQLGDKYLEQKRILNSSKSISFPEAPTIKPNQGMEIQIKCPIPSIISTDKIYWFKNNQLISNGDSVLYKTGTYYIVSKDAEQNRISTLGIKNIGVSDEGLYKCYHRGIKFHSVTVKVNVPITLTTTPKSTLEGQNGYLLGFGMAIVIVVFLVLALWLTRIRRNVISQNKTLS